MGGSIRIPASECALVGLKPTRARNSLGPDFAEYWGLTTHEHVLTRSVRDTAAVLDATAGPAVGDPYSAPPPERPFLDEVGADPGRLHIGIRTRRGRGDTDAHPDCTAAVLATARLLESLGHFVEMVDIPEFDHPALGDAITGLFGVFVARDLDRWSAVLGREIAPSELEPWNQAMAEMGRSVTATQYVEALEAANTYSRQLGQWWANGFDILVTPQLAEPPPRLGVISPTRSFEEQFEIVSALASFTMPFNLTGQPAMSLPLHWNDEGLPIGVQFAAAYAREDVLLRLAAQLEIAQPWADRHPPGF
jgi:amidase